MGNWPFAPVGGGLIPRLANRGRPTRAKGPPFTPVALPTGPKGCPTWALRSEQGSTLFPRFVTPTGVKGFLNFYFFKKFLFYFYFQFFVFEFCNRLIALHTHLSLNILNYNLKYSPLITLPDRSPILRLLYP